MRNEKKSESKTLFSSIAEKKTQKQLSTSELLFFPLSSVNIVQILYIGKPTAMTACARQYDL